MDRLREDLRIVRQALGGEVSYVVRDPVAQKYYRFRPLEYAVLEKLDGTLDCEEIARLLALQKGARLSSATVEKFVVSLRKLNLLAQTMGEKSIALLERLRSERKLRTGRTRGTLLYLRFPAVDPDRLYNRLLPHLRFLWSRGFLAACLALFAVAAAILIADWATVKSGVVRLWDSRDPLHLVLAYLVMFTVAVFHENAHGLTCKHYGGEVHEMGFMLIYFLPAFYANVTDATTFQSKAAKLWVTAAGSFVELVICSLATLVWYFTTPGHFVNELAFLVVVVAGISSIPINMNPLIKLDGYFALADWLEIPNLNDRARKYCAALARRRLFRLPAEIPSYSDRVRRLLLAYGSAAFVYRLMLLGLVVLFFYRKLGGILLAGLAFLVLRKRLGTLWSKARYLYLDKRDLFRRRRWLIGGGLAGAALAGALLVPLPRFVTVPFVLHRPERVLVRAETAGFVARVAVQEGSAVRRGDTLALLRNPELEQAMAALRFEVEELSRRAQRGLGAGDFGTWRKENQRREQTAAALAEKEARAARLHLVAPVDGVVATPQLRDREGRALHPGELLCEIAPSGGWIARLYVEEASLEPVIPGAAVSLRLDAGGPTLRGEVRRLAEASQLHRTLSQGLAEPEPAAASLPDRWKPPEQRYLARGGTSFAAPVTQYEAIIEILSRAEGWETGMSGWAKVYGRSRPLAVAAWEAARNSLRSRIW